MGTPPCKGIRQPYGTATRRRTLDIGLIFC
jgi:hypothetical protein